MSGNQANKEFMPESAGKRVGWYRLRTRPDGEGLLDVVTGVAEAMAVDNGAPSPEVAGQEPANAEFRDVPGGISSVLALKLFLRPATEDRGAVVLHHMHDFKPEEQAGLKLMADGIGALVSGTEPRERKWFVDPHNPLGGVKQELIDAGLGATYEQVYYLLNFRVGQVATRSATAPDSMVSSDIFLPDPKMIGQTHFYYRQAHKLHGILGQWIESNEGNSERLSWKNRRTNETVKSLADDIVYNRKHLVYKRIDVARSLRDLGVIGELLAGFDIEQATILDDRRSFEQSEYQSAEEMGAQVCSADDPTGAMPAHTIRTETQRLEKLRASAMELATFFSSIGQSEFASLQQR